MSQISMSEPLYYYTSQVGPRFGNSRSLVEWKWCRDDMVEADVHFRQLHASILDISMLSQGHMVAPLYHYTGQVSPRFGNSGSREEWKWCHNVIVEAGIHIRPLHTSIFDIYKVCELLVCFRNGILVHPSYTVTLAKLPPDLGIQLQLRSGNDAPTSWLRLIFTPDHFKHSY